jgi:hypothetical protein
MDANSWGEAERRRVQFRNWLLKAWDWAEDNEPRLASKIAGLIGHAGEPDYPIWEMAEQLKLVGDGAQANTLRRACGVPVIGPKASGWEKQINHSPVIKLDKAVWEQIYTQLGWANRDSDTSLKARSFWLWSNAANMIRFVVKEEMVELEVQDAGR